jgi:hypothetical protein
MLNIQAFFSMPFFQVNEKFATTNNIWIFFAASVPATLVVFSIYLLKASWHKVYPRLKG